MKRIVKFINTCPFSLAPAIWFFSYHRKTRRISRRLAHLFGLVSPQATSRRTAPGRRFSLSACTRVSRRTFSWPETFSWQQPEQRMKSFSLSSSPRWRRRRRGTRRTTPRRRGSLSLDKDLELIIALAWMEDLLILDCCFFCAATTFVPAQKDAD